MTSIAVVVATFGDPSWQQIAERAAASVTSQTRPADDLIVVHDVDLATARNRGAAQADTTHLVFLDADDELDPGYLEAMAAAGDIDLGRPSTFGIYSDGTTEAAPSMIPRTDMRRRNCVVISALVRRSMFTAVGGFVDLPALEDWHLWRRLLNAGAELVDVPDAVLRIHVRERSRNQDQLAQAAAYRRVLRET